MITFCLIHGQWHDGSCWDPVVDRLRARGHDAVAPDMPFDDPRADYEERARPAMEGLDGIDGPVVVVEHSIASVEATLVAAARHPALLVHVCPGFGTFAAPSDSPNVFGPGFPFHEGRRRRSAWTPQGAIEAMYARLPPETGRELAERLRPGAAAVGDYPISQHPNLPTALIYTADDEFSTPEWERFVAHELLRVEPIEIPGGHFPMAEDPEALADLLDRLASDATASRPAAAR